MLDVAVSAEEKSILIVDDNEEVLESVREILSRRGYRITLARDVASAFTLANSLVPDLVVVDIDLGPGGDGIDLCHELRGEAKTGHIPILMLTGAVGTSSRTRAFTAGCDDYLEKPVLPEELLARVDSKLRRWSELRPARGAGNALRCGNLVLAPERNEAVVAGEVRRLSSIEFALLRIFVEQPERIIRREDILTRVWSGVTVGARTVDAHLSSLRKKLKSFDFEIANVYGSGFILRRRRAA